MRSHHSSPNGYIALAVAGALFLLLFFNVWNSAGRVGNGIVRAASPLAGPLGTISGRIAEIGASVFAMRNTGEGIGELQRLVVERERNSARLRVIEEENAFLRESLKMQRATPGEALTTRQLGFFRDGRDELILLDRGTDDGVREGQYVVMASSTLVGRIVEVWSRQSKALLVTSPSQVLEVSIVGKEPEVISRGNNIRELVIDFVPVSSSAAVGDIIATNAKEERLGAGFIVGVVTEVRDIESNVFRYVRARSLFDPKHPVPLFILLALERL